MDVIGLLTSQPVIFATAAMLGLGLLCAVMLAAASKIFYVEEDPRIAMVEDVLLGANCGGCGFAGCSAAAEAVVMGSAPASVCIAGGPDIGKAVGAVMGMAVEEREKEIAVLNCRGAYRVNTKFDYQGIQDCRAAVLFWDGARDCDMSCMGLGTCVAVCPFDAVTMGDDGLPFVDPNVCTGCGTCVKNCPKHVLHLESVSRRLLTFNRADQCLAPCRQTCPAQIDIPKYINHIQNRRHLAAVETVKERNPMPLSIGRVCPHPCEDECRRRFVDEAVNINHLKRYCADYEMYVGPRNVTYVAPDTHKRVAIIGGGPGGLACACYLRRLGHAPEIFDMMPKLGGMCRYGIPEYRLPKKILDWEVQSILDLGIKVHYETKLGEDFTIQSLKEDSFRAIFVAIGAWTSSSMRAEGEDLPGVLGGIEFLIQQGLGEPFPLGDKVVVIGGGNTAIDAARTSLRRGCKEVIILYRRTRREMPANEIEIVEAEREGVKFHFLAAPAKLYPGDDGKVAKLEFIRMELGEPDASGRRRPVPIEGSNTMMDVDNMIAAIGQRPDVKFDGEAGEEFRLGTTKWATFEADEATLQTKVPYVFTGGDVYTGPQTVVKAIGAGRRAARSIHLYITGQEVVPPPNEQKGFTPESRNTQILGVPTGPRAHMVELPLEARMNFNEVELGLPESEALRETHRCLQCGNVCYSQEAFEKMFAPVK